MKKYEAPEVEVVEFDTEIMLFGLAENEISIVGVEDPGTEF